MEKKCLICKSKFTRNPRYSQKQWDSSKFCSMRCLGVHQKTVPHRSGWKHLPETLEKMKKNSTKNRFTSQTYGSIHQWLRKNFRKGPCEHCGGVKFVEFAKKNNVDHKHNRENYLLLCSSCHKKYDYTPERRARLSNALKGRVIHWKDKISKANRGRVLSSETRKKYSEYRKKHPRERGKNGRFISL